MEEFVDKFVLTSVCFCLFRGLFSAFESCSPGGEVGLLYRIRYSDCAYGLVLAALGYSWWGTIPFLRPSWRALVQATTIGYLVHEGGLAFRNSYFLRPLVTPHHLLLAIFAAVAAHDYAELVSRTIVLEAAALPSTLFWNMRMNNTRGLVYVIGYMLSSFALLVKAWEMMRITDAALAMEHHPLVAGLLVGLTSSDVIYFFASIAANDGSVSV